MIKNKKALTVTFVTLICAVSLIFAFSTNAALATANIEELSDKIRVAVGNTASFKVKEANEYIKIREGVVDEISLSKPFERNLALLTLNEFMDVDAVNELLSSVADKNEMQINEVYTWTPGKTGRAFAVVKNNDIEASIQRLIKDTLSNENIDPVQATDIEELQKNGQIFAVVITTTNENLALLAKSNKIFVDPVYSAEAEAMARSSGKEVSYIYLPAKPDGTL